MNELKSEKTDPPARRISDQSHSTQTDLETDAPGDAATRRRLLTAVLVAYWAALFTATHLPRESLDRMPRVGDKLEHLCGYAGLAFLAAAWLSARRRVSVREYAAVFGLTVIYSVADELLQIPVGRTAEALDALADWLGSLLGLGAHAVLFRYVLRRGDSL